MKTRSGYVSNSSTSSFIVAYNHKDYVRCQSCGYEPDTIVDLCERDDAGYSGEDTDVNWTGIDGWVESYQDEMMWTAKSIAEHSTKDPDALAYPQWNSRTTAKEALAECQQDLVEMEDTIERIKQWGEDNPDMTVASVSISYGSPLNDTIAELEQRGLLIQLDPDTLPPKRRAGIKPLTLKE